MTPGAGMVIGAGINAGMGLLSTWLTNKAQAKAAKIQADAALRVGQAALDTSEQNAQDIYAAGERGATDVTAAARQAGAGVWLSADDANALLRSIYGDNMAALEPYTTTGGAAVRRLGAGLEVGGEFDKTFTGADLENEPGYQFGLSEGAKVLERSAARRGTLLGGRGLKEMERFAQDYAGTKFGEAFQRFDTNRKFTREGLFNLSNVGLGATQTGIGAGETYGGRAAGNIMNAGRYEGDTDIDATTKSGEFRMRGIGAAGDYRMKGLGIWGDVTTGGANAQAAATLGANNSVTNTLSGIGRTAWDLSYLNALPRKPWEPAPLPTGPVQGPTPPGTPSSVMTPQQAEEWWRITHPTGAP